MKVIDQYAEGIIAVLLLALVLALALRFRPAPQAGEPLPRSPTTIQFESKDHATVTAYELDVVDADGAVVQTLVLPKARTTVVGETAEGPTIEAVVDLYPLGPGVFVYLIRAVTETNPVDVAGARTPPLPYVVDAAAAKWTLDGMRVLRDGEDTGGSGTQVLRWDAPAPGTIYVAGEGGVWYQWWGGGYTAVASDPSGGAPVPAASVGRSGNSNTSNAWQRAPIAVF